MKFARLRRTFEDVYPDAAMLATDEMMNDALQDGIGRVVDKYPDEYPDDNAICDQAYSSLMWALKQERLPVGNGLPLSYRQARD